MPSKHKAGGCGCCSGCSDNESARVFLLASLGLSDITCSGGPVMATATQDFKQKTCAPDYPDGSSDPDYPAFDFSGSVISTISSTPTAAGYTVCAPTTGFPMGALQHACVSNDLKARGFGQQSSAFTTCGGSPNRDYFAYQFATVTFTCTSGVASYRLQIQTSLIMFVRDSTGYFSVPGASGTDWTRTGSGLVGIYTKNGTNADSGAVVSWRLLTNFGTFSTYELIATTYTNNPNTSVSMWVPNPQIDWTGLTEVGTATLS